MTTPQALLADWEDEIMIDHILFVLLIFELFTGPQIFMRIVNMPSKLVALTSEFHAN